MWFFIPGALHEFQGVCDHHAKEVRNLISKNFHSPTKLNEILEFATLEEIEKVRPVIEVMDS